MHKKRADSAWKPALSLSLSQAVMVFYQLDCATIERFLKPLYRK